MGILPAARLASLTLLRKDESLKVCTIKTRDNLNDRIRITEKYNSIVTNNGKRAVGIPDGTLSLCKVLI